MPKKTENIKKIYEEIFKKTTRKLYNDSQLNYLLSILPSDKSIYILDAGCGNGRYSDYIIKLGYKNVYAVDIVSHCPVKNIHYQTASIDNLPFHDHYFDLVFANSVIYYVSPPDKALIEFSRVLKKDGILMFTAHTKWSLFTLKRLINRDFLKLSNMAHLEGVKFYSANYYKNLLDNFNFEVILRDGWQTSFFIYPFYKIAARIIKKTTTLEIPEKKVYITRQNTLGKIKSEMSYHCIFIARKLNDLKNDCKN